jgi:hypothetical protein
LPLQIQCQNYDLKLQRSIVYDPHDGDIKNNNDGSTAVVPDLVAIHLAIDWPLRHVIVALSRSRWSACMNTYRCPAADALAKEIVDDLFA